MTDWTIIEGDTAPVFDDTLSYGDGTSLDLSGATVEFVMRSLTADAPLTLTGATTVTGAATVRFTPSSDDTTGNAGRYMAVWRVTFPGGAVMTFPTVGYLTVEIVRSLAASAAQLVNLADVKAYMGIPAGEREHDEKLVRAIEAVRPVVENITGPIVIATYDERHDGGGPFIQIRRRPSTAFGTAPVLELLTATEDLGSTTRDLTIVTNPALGSSFSCMIDPIGTISRLAGGGGRTAFAGGIDSVHVTYRAGQASIPANVYEGTLELLRVNYQPTMAAGRGRFTVADDQDTGVPLGFFVPRRVRELLAPNRRAPAVA